MSNSMGRTHDSQPDGAGRPARSTQPFDPEALEALWQSHRRWVAAILLAHMPREADVEDLLQEVAVRLVQHIDEIQGPESLRPWLRTVAINVARTQGRRQRIRRAAFPRLSEDPIPRMPAPETGPGEEQDRARLALELSRNLPDEYREPLLLRAVRGLSYRQIADILSVPITTVETRLVRARRMLREQIEMQTGEGSPSEGARAESESGS
jgi:RNA polymerase sigma-70 factor (ECF subfamily)